MTRLLLPATLFLALLSPLAASIVINPVFVDADGETWTDVRKGVINQAIADWAAVIDHPQAQPFDVTFTFATSDDYLGQWQGGGSFFNGTDLYPWTPGMNHTIRFETGQINDATNPFWFDPTPQTDGDLAFTDYDVLSVARHELGHLFGFTTLYVDDFNTGSEVNRWTSLISGSTFDPGGLNVALASASNVSHIAFTGSFSTDDLMVPAIPNSFRRDISQLNIDMLVLAHDYVQVPEPSHLALVLGGIVLVLAWRRRR